MVDMLIIGKRWFLQDDIKAKTHGEIVFWDKFWGKGKQDNLISANSMSNRDNISDVEVLATLSGFQYQGSGKSFYLDVLKSDISNHLLSKAPQDIKSQGHNPSFTWSTTGANTVFKVKCSSSELARWLCVKLVDLSVKQAVNLGPYCLQIHLDPFGRVTGNNTSANSAFWM